MTLAQPHANKRKRTVAREQLAQHGLGLHGVSPVVRTDRATRRASGGRNKPHARDEYTTITIGAPALTRTPAAPVMAAPMPIRKGEAYAIPQAAGTTMKRGGAVDRFSHAEIKRRLGQ
jgi:hypothetical protein